MKTKTLLTGHFSFATITVTATLFFLFLFSSFVYCEVLTSVVRGLPESNNNTATDAGNRAYHTTANSSLNKNIQYKVIVNLSSTPAGCRALELLNTF